MGTRIRKLLKAVKQYRPAIPPYCFILDNGQRFIPDIDPVAYLAEHGTYTPMGEITCFQSDRSAADPLSIALYDAIEEFIGEGGVELPENMSDSGC